MNFVTEIAREQLQYAIDNDPNCFMKEKHELYGFTKDEQIVKISENEDVYELLSAMYGDVGYVGLSVHTTGWGAPIDDMEKYKDTPSEHPERRRVAIICAITNEGVCAAMAFADEQNKISVDTEIEGRLADGIRECWADMKENHEER
jgi:hypothetical protein